MTKRQTPHSLAMRNRLRVRRTHAYSHTHNESERQCVIKTRERVREKVL